jgi:hypothetical protein
MSRTFEPLSFFAATGRSIRWRPLPNAAYPDRMMGSTDWAHAVLEDCDHARELSDLPGDIGPIAREYLRIHGAIADFAQDVLDFEEPA